MKKDNSDKQRNSLDQDPAGVSPTIEINEDLVTRFTFPEGSITSSAANEGKPTIGAMDIPQERDADHIETLAQWGDIPSVLFIPEAVKFIAARCSQNPAAIQKIITNAVLRNELSYWGYSHEGGWIKDMVRILHRSSAKKDGDRMKISTCLTDPGRLHIEAMGVSPVQVVKLLARRGRKIPPELRDLIHSTDATEQYTQPTTKPVQRQQAHEMNIVEAIIGLGLEPKSLPPRIQGKSGTKAAVKALVTGKGSMMTAHAFKHAWDRLLRTGDVAYLE